MHVGPREQNAVPPQSPDVRESAGAGRLVSACSGPAAPAAGDRIDRAGRTAYVRHGSVAVDARIERPFEQSEAYLRKDSAMRAVFDRVEHGREATYVRAGTLGTQDGFDSATRRIDWSPHSAFRVGGALISPALALGHELDHASVDAGTAARGSAIPLAGYDNAEEARVIRGSEAHAAQTLGEPVRHSHRVDGTIYVARPVDHGW